MPVTTAPTTTVSTTTAPTTRTNRAIHLAGRLVIAPVLLIAPLVTSDRAAADCTPVSPVNNTTVTCTGTTGSKDVPVGFGTDTDKGNTINVQTGASVTGTVNGLRFNDGTVNNFGTITGHGTGVFDGAISAVETATVFNSGTITGDRRGILAFTAANITNFGFSVLPPNSYLPGVVAGTSNLVFDVSLAGTNYHATG